MSLVPSPPRAFSGESLREIAFPLGGIGTGTVSLGGRGQLRDWEIFNRPGKGRDLPYTFFALWARARDQGPVARVLERRFLPPYSGATGIPTARAPGLPRLAQAVFVGEYPVARMGFGDESLPVRPRLEAFSPFVPLDAERSGMPVAIFLWSLENVTAVPVEATIAFSLFNAVGYDGQAPLRNRRHPLFGQNRNEFREEGSVRGLAMTTVKYPPDHPHFGSLAVVTPWNHVTFSERWQRAGWWDDLQDFWDDFAADGGLPNLSEPVETPEGETDVGTLGLRIQLGPRQTGTVPFVLAWHVPNLVNTWNREGPCQAARLGNYYARRYEDAWAAGTEAARNLDALRAGTLAFHDALFSSTLPPPVLDAVSSQLSTLRSTTCLRTEDGRFHAFEGCHDNAGCCPMNCTHVWNYEQSLAFLFPELERTMRRTDFAINTRPDGRMAFRSLLPLSPDTLWGGPPAADGQMGCILKLYREWQLCGDDDFLRELWPGARAALAYAWEKWDGDRDGVMEGEQHNTYDVEFYGPNTMCGTLYLAALAAGEKMAARLGEDEFACECRSLFESGSRKYNARLWNGEYYAQEVVAPAGGLVPEGLGSGTQSVQDSGELRYQYGPGCLSDQLLGQWFARVVGLGDLLPAERVRSALAAIFRHNFRSSLAEHANCQRVYALDDEGGLLLCSWPRGGRPRFPFPYADEVWTGIEYQVAAHCIYEGLVEEGLQIAGAARARHDGARRNPWDEVECGHHYARALSSWSLLLALSGFHFSAAAGMLQFRPRVCQDRFRCFFTAGHVWGIFSQRRRPGHYRATLEIRGGELQLSTLDLPLASAARLQVSLDRRAVTARLDEPRRLEFSPQLSIPAGSVLEVVARTGSSRGGGRARHAGGRSGD